MVLHIFAKGLNEHLLLEKCLAIATTDDAIVFIEDGIHWASDSPISKSVLACQNRLYYLQEDAKARGMKRPSPLVTAVNYDGLVDLTVTHKSSLSWY